MSDIDRSALIEHTLDMVLGLGPIEKMLKDDSVTEIMVNGPAPSSSNAMASFAAVTNATTQKSNCASSSTESSPRSAGASTSSVPS